MKEIIYKRKSTRKYKDVLVENFLIDEILSFISTVKPLYPEIKYKLEIINRENIKSVFSWLPNQALAVFTEHKDGYLENIGFICQQIDL